MDAALDPSLAAQPALEGSTASGGAPGAAVRVQEVLALLVSGYTHLRVIKGAWAAPDKHTLD